MTGFALGGVAMGRLYDRLGVMVAIMLGTLALGSALSVRRWLLACSRSR